MLVDSMATLAEREEELRLFLQSIEEQIEKFEKLKEQFMNKHDSIKAEMQAHDLKLVPVKIVTNDSEDIVADIEKHLVELSKLKAYISNEIKKVVEEKKTLEVLEAKFGHSVEIAANEEGFEIKYKDEQARDAFEELKKDREKIANIKTRLRKIEDERKTSSYGI